MRPSFKYVTPFLVAAATAACSSSENNPGGQGGSSQTAKGGNAGANSTSGGTGSGSGGANNPAQGGSTNNSGGQNANSGGSAQGGSSNNSGGQNTNSGGSSQGGSSNNSGGKSNSGGSTQGGSSNNSGGSANGGSTSSGGSSASGGAGGGSGTCTNTDPSKINLDASGYVCNNSLGIKGAWYCYSDGSDSGTSCKGSDGKGAGAVPWNATAGAMCMSGTTPSGDGKYAGMGFKVNSGPPGDKAAFGSWDASKLVGFAITLTSGSSGKGSNGTVLNLNYPTTDNLDSKGDSPAVTLPGVGGTEITYNVLFADAVLANNKDKSTKVDPTKLTDVKLTIPPDSVSHAYDFCIKSIVPLMTAPNPVVATGNYGPTWNNQKPQAVNGVNGYAVQSAPFPDAGNPMTMQVKATAGGVGFTYNAGSGFQAPNNGPGAFPAIISGYGPGHDGIQFYGPYKEGKKISQLTSVKSNWSFTMGSTGNAAYDVWFSKSAANIPAVELMIWIGNTGKNALGNSAGAAFMGKTPYVGTNGTGEQVISYWVAAPGATSVTDFDLLPFFKDAASHGYAGLTNDSVLLGVQTGFEVYSGNWSTTDYNINIQ